MNETRVPDLRVRRQPASIILKPHGFVCRAPEREHQYVQPDKIRGGKRGKVGVFSLASRRRLSDALLNLEYRRGLSLSATFTFPGAVLTDEDCKAVFKRWSQEAERRGWSAVWRMEIQKRKMIHYHLWLGVPHEGDTWECKIVHGGKNGVWPDFCATVAESWFKAEDSLGPRLSTLAGGMMLLRTMPGHEQYGVGVEFGDEAQADFWFRYMASHALKDTQQVATGRGRHWGIIGRAGFDRAPDLGGGKMSDETYAAVMAEYNAVSRPAMQERLAKLRAKMEQPLSAEDAYRLEKFEQKIEKGMGNMGTWRVFGRGVMEDILKRHGVNRS